MWTRQRIIGHFVRLCLLVLVPSTVYFVFLKHQEILIGSAGRTGQMAPNISETAPLNNDTRTFQLKFNADSTIVIAENMSLDVVEELYFKYLFHLHYICEDYTRLGSSVDGGWNVCLMEPYRFAKSCLVYSFGIHYDFSFDDAVSIKYGCTVRSFDPSMKVPSHRRGPNIWFYDIGISGIDDPPSPLKWKLKTLQTLVHELGDSNKIIDYLKMDVENAEWESLESMFKTDILQCRVKQIGFEIHSFAQSRTVAEYYKRWKILNRLEEIGFRRWDWHLNWYGSYFHNGHVRACCYEIIYINTAFLNETMRTNCRPTVKK